MPIADELAAQTPACPHCGGPAPCPTCTRNVRRPGTTRRDDTLTAILPVGRRPDEAEIDRMLRSRGYHPAEWRIVSLTVNQWEALGKDGETRVLTQTKATLRRQPPEAETEWGRFLAGLRTVTGSRAPGS